MNEFIKGDRGVAGERGERGDHGQDGRQGPQGTQGEAGEPGKAGRRGPSILGTDRRLVFLFVYVTAGMVVLFFVLQHSQSNAADKERKFELQIVANCQQTHDAAVKFNAFLNQSITNALRTKGLTPAQKRQSIKAESDLHQPVQKCPPKP